MRLLKSFLASFVLLTALASAQVVSDRVTTSCEGETRRLYDALNAGRPVVVATLAFDCWEICNPAAPAVGAFAREQRGRIDVWAPMFTLEHAGKTPATCDSMPAWRARHGWTGEVHAFIDEPVTWAYELKGGHFFVIDPRWQSIAYAGDDFARASEVAIALAGGVAGVEDAWALPTMLDLR